MNGRSSRCFLLTPRECPCGLPGELWGGDMLISPSHLCEKLLEEFPDGLLEQLPRQPIPGDLARELLHDNLGLFHGSLSIDGTPLDECPEPGAIEMTAPDSRWRICYSGDPDCGQLCEFRAGPQGEERRLLRCEPGLVELLTLELREDDLVARAYRIDRHSLQNSGGWSLQWPPPD